MQSSLLGIAEVKPVLCKDSANRMQSSLLGIAEVKPVLCKDSANRMQSSLLGIAEVKPVLCKGIDFLMNTKGWNVKYDQKSSYTT